MLEILSKSLFLHSTFCVVCIAPIFKHDGMNIKLQNVNNHRVKKERNLSICFFALATIYVASVCFLPTAKMCWFEFGLFVLGIYMCIKAYVFRSDSATFMAFLLVFCSLVFCKLFGSNFDLSQTFSLIGLGVSLAFFVSYLFFEKSTLLFLFFVNILLNLPFFLYAFHCINLLLMISLLCGALATSFLVLSMKKNGKI